MIVVMIIKLGAWTRTGALPAEPVSREDIFLNGVCSQLSLPRAQKCA